MVQSNLLASVVVPVYNVEDFLSECIDSIINQSHTNVEIILVNDGSTDSSGELCDRYAKDDKRIRVFHQQNEGVSSARNNGINNARGDYITFVDADDAIHYDYVKNLLDDLITSDSTTVTTAAKDTASRQINLLSEPVKDDEITLMSIDDTLLELYRGDLEGARNGVQMFSLKMLNENGIRYNENMAIGEDFDFFARAILASNKVVVDKRRMYFYRSNPSSAMTQTFSRKHFDAIKNIEQVGRSVEHRIPGLKKAIDTAIFADAVFYGAKVFAVRRRWPVEYNEIMKLLKKYRFMVLTNNNAKRNVRIKAFLVTILGMKLGLMATRKLIRW